MSTTTLSEHAAKAKKNTEERPYLIIDGFNVFLRHFMVNQEISSRSVPIGGAVGFLKAVNYLTAAFCPSKIIVVWESGGPSPRRKRIAPEYKANRSKLKEIKKIQKGTESMRDVLALDDENRVQQLTILANLLKATPVCQVYVPDTECDDVIGYLVKEKFSKHNAKKIIVSNDKDFYQLLDDPMVEIYDPATKNIVNGPKVKEKFGISARNYCLAKTLAGDPSDNIEGVPGVGFKTIAKRFPSLSSEEDDVTIGSLLEQAQEGLTAHKRPPRVYSDVAQSEKLLRRNWSLMYLNSSTMSASQISKVNYIVDEHEPMMDKLQLIKIAMEAGISTNFDYDRFSAEMRIFVK